MSSGRAGDDPAALALTASPPTQARPEPFLEDADFTLYVGDVLDTLRELDDESVHCVVTSPPYWGLRDYGTGEWDGGDPDCDHLRPRTSYNKDFNQRWGQGGGDRKQEHKNDAQYPVVCEKCGALRLDRQLGLESTPELYVTRMVEVFREVRRVLRSDGTCWLNIGDSYASSDRDYYAPDSKGAPSGEARAHASRPATPAGIKPKDLVGIPWALAEALRAPYYTGQIRDERDRVWLAATIDAEGSICGVRHERKDDGRVRTGLQITITNTSLALLEEAQRIWPTSRADGNFHPHGRGHQGHRPVWRWIPYGAEKKAMLMRELYPYLVVKQKQALLAYNLALFQADGKRLGRSPHGPEIRAKRELLVRLLGEANAQRDFDIPSWCVEPPPLYEQGWYLRSEIIWSKPNPMPESVNDRPTKGHEQIFLLARSPRYFYDAEAIREPAEFYGPNGKPKEGPHAEQAMHIRAADARSLKKTPAGQPALTFAGIKTIDAEPTSDGGGRQRSRPGDCDDNEFKTTDERNTRYQGPNPTDLKRNKRTVWEIATEPYPQAHFATFPQDLVEPCLKAGTSGLGCCPVCLAGWEPEVDRTLVVDHRLARGRGAKQDADDDGDHGAWGTGETVVGTYDSKTTGWRPTCECFGWLYRWQEPNPAGGKPIRRSVYVWPDRNEDEIAAKLVPPIALDPFLGSGTVAFVARRLGRRSVGIELNEEYAELAGARLAQQSLFA